VSWFDPELGIGIDTTMNQDIKMSITMPVNLQGKKTTQTMTNLMNQVVAMKLDSVK
jgi:hypothetical protein